MRKEKIGILGAGLVGTLLSILLSKKGFNVSVFEKRSDPRTYSRPEGRSINLALSHRGIRTLKMAGIFDQIKPLLIPMFGRSIHTDQGLSFHSYGTSDQHINSISRYQLNSALIEHAAKSTVNLHFETLIEAVDTIRGVIKLDSGVNHDFDYLIGADGAFSVLRRAMIKNNDKHKSEEKILTHGYKELTIPSINNEFAIDPNSLHIWPRKSFMLIALPNLDKTFTCTLFLDNQGAPSFDQLNSSDAIGSFFRNHFPEIISLIPNYLQQFLENPTSSLGTIKAYPWVHEKSLLIGDAAHSIVPFYGQGMNAGFEDCRILLETLETNQYNWDVTLNQFQKTRKPDADAIAQLALENFIEMRDHVIDELFLKRKELEAIMHKAFPSEWVPLYSMVTFSDLPYHEALETGKLQLKAIETLGRDFDPKSVDLKLLINTFKKLKTSDH